MSFSTLPNTNPEIKDADTYTGPAIPNPETLFASQQIIGPPHSPDDPEVNPEIQYARTYTGPAIPNPETPSSNFNQQRLEPF